MENGRVGMLIADVREIKGDVKTILQRTAAHEERIVEHDDCFDKQDRRIDNISRRLWALWGVAGVLVAVGIVLKEVLR